ncbi:MAG: hypothetical protein K9L24_03455 [Spirochaetia bacterium]|nr:hypothetical protein [Spirochaetia bacterium]MCF7945890.1 hypothetical protein [Spirochaetia bacterium]
MNLRTLERALANEYLQNGYAPSYIKEHSIYKAFSDKFHETINPELIDLRIWKRYKDYYLFSSFSAPGNCMYNPDYLISVENLQYISGINAKATFLDVETLLCNDFDVEDVALSGLGNASLLKPKIEKYIRYKGDSIGIECIL